MLKNIFRKYDEDNSGTIDKEEMFFLVKSMMDGIKGSEEVKIYTKPKLRDLKYFEGTPPEQDEFDLYVQEIKQREESKMHNAGVAH